MRDDEQDWRLRADIDDAPGVLGRMREASHFERELEPLVRADVVLSADDDTLFAYANTWEAIEETRRALEHALSGERREAKTAISHWSEQHGEWRQVDPPPDAAEVERERRLALEEEAERERDSVMETRTVAFTAGRMVRKWFETTAADEAREVGVELTFVEHPHLLSTQIVFTLAGQRGKINQVIADMQSRAGLATRLETAYLAPF